MKYCYYIAKKNFDSEWARLANFYAKEGMSQDAIQEMHDFDWKELPKQGQYSSFG